MLVPGNLITLHSSNDDNSTKMAFSIGKSTFLRKPQMRYGVILMFVFVILRFVLTQALVALCRH